MQTMNQKTIGIIKQLKYTIKGISKIPITLKQVLEFFKSIRPRLTHDIEVIFQFTSILHAH